MPLAARQTPTPGGSLRSAFTLIELLVVISILALLVAMLLPALTSARGVAQSAQCKSNEKNIGIAFYGYAQSFKDYYPGPYTTNSGISFEDKLGKQGYLGATRLDVPMLTTWGVDNYPGYVPTWDVLECPGEYGSPLPSMNGKTMFRFVGMRKSYQENWYTNGYGYSASPFILDRPGWSRGPTAVAMQGRLSEAGIIFDSEDSGMSWNLGYYQAEIDTKSVYTEYAFRHVGDTGNMLFWDGHVDSRLPMWISGISNSHVLREGNPGTGPDSLWGY